MAKGPAARLLDLSRLVSRLGQGPATGIDRVEIAYLDALLLHDIPAFGLVRRGPFHLLLDRSGMGVLRSMVHGPGDALTDRGQDDADALRALAVTRCLRPFLGRMLRNRLPAGTSYLNVGHANLTRQVLSAVRSVPGAQLTVMVHDTIPLDHPEYTRRGRTEVFARRMRRVARHADLVLCNSDVTRGDVARHFAGFGRVPPLHVAHLGVTRVPPGGLPAGVDPARAFFLALGTIEPRKNHVLLLDVWDRLARDAASRDLPQLVIVGRRGWNNEDVFARLDASPLRGTAVLEFGDLDDGAVSALMAKARALMFPSHAEGFGLPLVEAMAAGLPALCSPLPVFRELAGNWPRYLPGDDVTAWTEAVRALAVLRQEGDTAARSCLAAPGWDEHFDDVFRLA